MSLEDALQLHLYRCALANKFKHIERGPWMKK